MAESAAADGKAAANGAGGGGDAAGDGKKRADQAVAFHELFSYADKWDLMLMAAGSLGALAHGAAMPLFFLLFGDLINGFGKNQTDLRTMTDEVAKVRTSFSPLGSLKQLCHYQPPISDRGLLPPRSPLLVATRQCVCC
jgi:ATP-binding cassette subfamily B (MDR/TAP) protein 1